MTLGAIYEELDRLSPFEMQAAWDNSGLIVGSFSDSVETIVISLDIDAALIEQAPKGALFIVHHPLIFGKLTALDFGTYPANLLLKMIQKEQKMIAMHTNFDLTHLNAYVATEVLGLVIERQEEHLIYASCESTLQECAVKVQEALGLASLKIVEGKKEIKSVALCTGSGASLIPQVTADLFLTGDIKYHDAMTAKSLNLSMIEIGHFESERYFSEVLAKQLKDWSISVIISNSKNPFTYR